MNMHTTMHPASATPVEAILGQFNRDQVSAFIEVAIGLLDALDGNSDCEDATGLEDDFVDHPADGPGCPIADIPDHAYSEWQSRGRHKLDARGAELADSRDAGWSEDAEDDDPAEEDDAAEDDDPDCCPAGDDRIFSGPTNTMGLLYPDLGPGDDTDNEREQMHDDVPMPRVFSAAHNVFTDERVPLGISNMQSSFVGRNVRSADSGEHHTRMPHNQPVAPGQPV